jgi:hypothetical protein
MVSGSLVSAITVPEVINQRLSHRVQPTRLRIAAAWARHARVPAHLHPRRQALIFRTPVTPDAHWRTLLAENAPTPQPGGPPVFLAQGDEDPVIPRPLPATSPAGAAGSGRLCATSRCRGWTIIRLRLAAPPQSPIGSPDASPAFRRPTTVPHCNSVPTWGVAGRKQQPAQEHPTAPGPGDLAVMRRHGRGRDTQTRERSGGCSPLPPDGDAPRQPRHLRLGRLVVGSRQASAGPALRPAPLPVLEHIEVEAIRIPKAARLLAVLVALAGTSERPISGANASKGTP